MVSYSVAPRLWRLFAICGPVVPDRLLPFWDCAIAEFLRSVESKRLLWPLGNPVELLDGAIFFFYCPGRGVRRVH